MRRLTLILCLLVAATSVAQSVYKYKNEKGEWVFTDRKPEVEQEYETAALLPDTTGPAIRIARRDTADGTLLVVTNEFFGPVEVGVLLTDLVNISEHTETRGRHLLPARSELSVVDVKAADASRPWSFEIYYHGALGDPSSKHRPSELYRIPFARSTTYRISQAYPGHYSHKDPSSQYAIDFALPIGTKVYAARSGVVIDIATNFFTSGTDLKKDGRRANLVRVLHDDGTMAMYAHLQWDSIRVRPGDSVQRGEYIAKSGNTGFTTGPHLHFDVQRNAGMKIISIRVQFEGPGGVAVTPKEGNRLTAY